MSLRLSGSMGFGCQPDAEADEDDAGRAFEPALHRLAAQAFSYNAQVSGSTSSAVTGRPRSPSPAATPSPASTAHTSSNARRVSPNSVGRIASSTA